MLDKNYLTPIKYFAGHAPELGKVKTTVRDGIRDYDPKALSVVYEDDKAIVGDVVTEWIEKGENSQTIAFSPSINMSKALVDKFNDAGIGAVHIDAYTKDEERMEIYQGHEEGRFKILSCSTLLDTGYNSKGVRCLIDCYPNKSIIRYVQKGGRLQRILEGKEYAIYLDHANNVSRHGFIEDIVPEELHDGEKKHNEDKLVKKKEKKDPKPCVQCGGLMKGLVCTNCGAEIPAAKEEQEVIEGELKELKRATEQERLAKREFWAGLRHYAQNKNFKEGWVNHKYKEKFGDWPNGRKPDPSPNEAADKYIVSRNIAYNAVQRKRKKIEKQGQDVINRLLKDLVLKDLG